MKTNDHQKQEMKAISILVSIPFAQHPCLCDAELLLTGEHPDIAGAYLGALHREILMTGTKFSDTKVSSVIFSGGPQQAFNAPEFYETIIKIYRNFTMNDKMVTLVNLDPWGLNPTICSMLRNIDHILPNIRMFSCNMDENKAINRGYPHHDVDYIAGQLKYGSVKQFGVVLYCGLPSQTQVSLLRSLDVCLAHQTALITLKPYGDQWKDFMLAAENILQTKGYRDLGNHRYARDDFEAEGLIEKNAETLLFGASLEAESASPRVSLTRTVTKYIADT
ncbi:MAG: hypothetical protein PHP02_09035 [Eubacteriales bacterium]|nr:hypothetical protein [Eubacteriales bacterium]